MLLAVTGRVCAQQVDPALTAAVVAQTAVLNDIYNISPMRRVPCRISIRSSVLQSW